MEAYNGPRWRHSHPGRHRARGAAHGNHLQRQNHTHPMERNNWGRNSMNGGPELWNGSGDHWPVYHHDMPRGKPMENGFGNNRWTNGNTQYLMNQLPRMEFHPPTIRGRMRPDTWRGGRGFNDGIRGHFHPRSHRGNMYFPPPTMPGPRPPQTLLETPLFTTTDTPHYSFPSPSTESENLPRDPRQRSPSVTSPHSINYQDRNHLMECHTPSFNPPDVRQNGFHSMDGELSYLSFSHRGNNTANYPHIRRDHGHRFFKDRDNYEEQQLNTSPQRLPVIEDGNTKTSVPCPANIASERFLIEHSYNSLCADKPVHHDRPSNEVFSGNGLHRTLVQCTSIDIPLPADCNSDGCHSNCNGIDTILATTHLINDCPDESIAKVITKDPRKFSLSEQTPLPDSVTLPLGVRLHSSVNNTNDCETADQVETIVDLELESSPLSLNGFEMDMESEIDSISSSPSRAGSDDNDDVIFIMSSVAPLSVSIPLNTVSLPTRLLLKHSLITKDPAVQPTDTPQVTKNRQPLEEATAVSGERSAKQLSDTMQLRNRVLPRNLFLFASRKGPSPRMKEENINVVTLDSSFDNTPPRDEIVTQSTCIVSNERKQESDVDMDWRSESSYEIESILNDHGTSVAVKRKTRSSSPSPYTPPAKIGKKSPSPASSIKRKFQDFIPVVLKSRSRAENKTILRRELMEMEMHKNEKERIDTLIPGEESNSSEEGIHYRTRKRRIRRQRDKCSPLNSQDDTNSIVSESVSSKEPESIQSSKDFPPDLVKYYNRVLSHSKNKSGSGDTPLHCLCRTGKYDVVSYVLTKELFTINVQDNAGWTPLHEACSKGHRDIVELLLQHGADPNLPATDGTRPIHDAVEAGNFEIVTVLVQHGADPMVEYSERTPLEIAKSAHFEDIASYLSEVCETRKQSVKQQDKTKPADVATASKKPTALNTTIVCDGEIKLPINGYSEPFLGPELDQPVFYVSATIEMSLEPMLPVYNLTVSSDSNPRKHNFHILEDVLEQLNASRDDILPRIAVNTYTLTTGEFIDQLKNNSLTKNAKILHKLSTIDKSCKLEMIPVCDDLRRLLSIKVENIDD